MNKGYIFEGYIYQNNIVSAELCPRYTIRIHTTDKRLLLSE